MSFKHGVEVRQSSLRFVHFDKREVFQNDSVNSFKVKEQNSISLHYVKMLVLQNLIIA